MAKKRLFSLLSLYILIQLLPINANSATMNAFSHDGLCGTPCIAELNPSLSGGLIYQSRIFEAEIKTDSSFSVIYNITPMEEHLNNWENWHPIHWMELFRIARAIDDFSEKTNTPVVGEKKNGFLLTASQYIDEETNSLKAKFTLTPCYTSEFLTDSNDIVLNRKKLPPPRQKMFQSIAMSAWIHI